MYAIRSYYAFDDQIIAGTDGLADLRSQGGYAATGDADDIQPKAGAEVAVGQGFADQGGVLLPISFERSSDRAVARFIV